MLQFPGFPKREIFDESFLGKFFNCGFFADSHNALFWTLKFKQKIMKKEEFTQNLSQFSEQIKCGRK